MGAALVILPNTHPTVRLSCSENTSETNLFTMQVFPTPLSCTRQIQIRRHYYSVRPEAITATDKAPDSPREGRASPHEAPFLYSDQRTSDDVTSPKY